MNTLDGWIGLASQCSLSQFLSVLSDSPYANQTDKTDETDNTDKNYIQSFLKIFLSFSSSLVRFVRVVSLFALRRMCQDWKRVTGNSSERSERRANPNLASKVWSS